MTLTASPNRVTARPVPSSPVGYSVAPWRTHMDYMYRGTLAEKGEDRWQQGDHIMIAGPTKAGKTTLMRRLVELRKHVVVFVTKQQDPTFSREFKGWTRLTEWPEAGPEPWQTRILLWPKPVKNDMKATLARQRAVFAHAMDRIATQGKRCVVIDETLMFTDPKFVGLGAEVGLMHYYGRSSGISMVTLTQRPAWIPKVIYSSVTHAYIARTRDKDDLKRLSDLGNIDPRAVALQVSALPTRHDYLYLNPQGDASPAIVNTRK